MFCYKTKNPKMNELLCQSCSKRNWKILKIYFDNLLFEFKDLTIQWHDWRINKAIKSENK